jgi:hypothetical protein
MSFAEVLEELPAMTLRQRQLLVRRALDLDESPLSPDDEVLVEKRLVAHHKNPRSSVSSGKIRLKKLSIILIAMFLSVAAFAADKIEGAFGMKLGDTFDTNSAIGMLKESEGTYQFSTTNEFRSFKNYFVKITPKTHKIYCIFTAEKTGDLQAGKKELAVVRELLKKQFGNEETLDDAKIQQGNRYVATKLVGNVDVTIAILFADSELKTLAEKEKAETKTNP